MYRFFVNEEQIQDDSIRITGDDVKHIAQVLRLSIGEEIIISNRQRTQYCCIISDMDKTSVLCRIISELKSDHELETKLCLFQGIPKQDKMEYIIQKSIELGVTEIIPVKMARSVVKISEKNNDKKSERWQKIAEAAAKQSGRDIVPTVLDPMTMGEAIRYASKLDKVIVPYEKASNIKQSKDILLSPKQYSSIGIFIGPEGGFDDNEINELEAHQATTITLGKRILRTETASVVILSILMYNLEVD